MIKDVENGIITTLRIVPNSSKNDLVHEEGFVKVKITAQPIENKANKALIVFLSKKFKISKTSIEILKGETSKDKTVLFKVNDKDKKSFIISQLTKC